MKINENNDISVNIVDSNILEQSIKSIKHFTRLTLDKFSFLRKILEEKLNASTITSIARLPNKKSNEEYTVIGMVLDTFFTKNGHIMLTVEDVTGSIKILINKSNRRLAILAKDIVYDEVIAVKGKLGENIMFASNIFWPDIPIDNKITKSIEDNNIVFISDFHIGSKLFLKEEFKKFLYWINGKLGNTVQREEAKKIKYLIIAGDLIEGIGVYPSQEDDLSIKTIRNQYKAAALLLSKIPSNIQIIISQGNHESSRLSEPQPLNSSHLMEDFKDMKNVKFVTNPAYVELEKTDNFKGILILIYHGYSIPYYADNVHRIRKAGGQKAVGDIMHFLLKRRHLAPTYGSNLIYPQEKDALIIDRIPDIFVTGHIHRVSNTIYRGVTCINSSCFVNNSPEQEKRGIEPLKARVTLMSLKTSETKIISFEKTTEVTN